jgi:hypothetical protein
MPACACRVDNLNLLGCRRVCEKPDRVGTFGADRKSYVRVAPSHAQYNRTSGGGRNKLRVIDAARNIIENQNDARTGTRVKDVAASALR